MLVKQPQHKVAAAQRTLAVLQGMLEVCSHPSRLGFTPQRSGCSGPDGSRAPGLLGPELVCEAACWPAEHSPCSTESLHTADGRADNQHQIRSPFLQALAVPPAPSVDKVQHCTYLFSKSLFLSVFIFSTALFRWFLLLSYFPFLYLPWVYFVFPFSPSPGILDWEISLP